MSGKVSVIIPAYNIQEHVEECINSVLNQTYQNYEILIVNDGSTDDTLKIVREYEAKNDKIKVFDISNHGQGYARNLALKESTGDYILFLDADDFLENVTLEVAVKKIENEKSDLVVFDWKYYFQKTGKYKYVNRDVFFGKKILEGEEVLDLFRIKHYFTVNKLYSKRFLTENQIQYGEGFLYEDNPFWVKVVIKANRVSLIHSPLYNVRVTDSSSTKTKMDTDIHYKSYIKAVEENIKAIREKPQNNYYYLYNYIVKKFNLYYKKRVPNRYKTKFMNDFVEVMSQAVPIPANCEIKLKNTIVRLGFGHNIFQKNRKVMFYFMYKSFLLKKYLRGKKNKWKKKIKKYKKKIKTKIKPPDKINYNIVEYKKSLEEEKQDIILFMGFDYRYTGNSRYLFEEFLNKGYHDNIYFVTDNELVEEKYRIEPNSEEMYKLFYRAKIVIFESWTLRRFRKTPNCIWIQLWHGTPLKKMLFDSEEAEIIRKNKKHKIYKYNDIQKWNYLVIDNKNIYSYFATAFLMPKEKVIPCGYPRVKYLIDNNNNKELKQTILDKANIPQGKKIVLYLPTWRDYNYGIKEESEMDYSYFLDEEELQRQLGDDYIVLSKNHTYLNTQEIQLDIETQELLLIADYLITDYSSVMFDAFAINLPVAIYANDFDKYSQSRGVYPEIWNDLNYLATDNIATLAESIKNYQIDDRYENIKQKYAYHKDTEYELIDFIQTNIQNKKEGEEEI